VSNSLPADPYYILGVSKEDDITQVKKKYFELAKKYHPDLNPNNEYSKKMFILVQEAY
jgi:curved DNA-binding protein CbpA